MTPTEKEKREKKKKKKKSSPQPASRLLKRLLPSAAPNEQKKT
jgi:hypothetical protein